MTRPTGAADAPNSGTEMTSLLRAGFGNRPAVPMADLSKMLMLDEKTLLRHVRSGRLPYRAMGTGRRRIRRYFTMDDVVQFFKNLGNPAADPVPPRRARTPWTSDAPGFVGGVERPTRRSAEAVRTARVSARRETAADASGTSGACPKSTGGVV